MMSACVFLVRVLSSSSLLFMPFMLTCRMMRFLSLLLLSLWMLVVFAVCAVQIVRVVSEFGTTLSMFCVCVGSAVAVGVAIVVFNVTWVFVADGELTGTGGSAAFDVCVVIEVRGVVLGEGVLCEVCICFTGDGVGGE